MLRASYSSDCCLGIYYSCPFLHPESLKITMELLFKNVVAYEMALESFVAARVSCKDYRRICREEMKV